MSDFWRKWLWVWCAAVGLFGIVLAGAAFEATSSPTALLLQTLGGAQEPLTPALRFATALMGCVTLGWAITMLASVEAAVALGERARPIWRMVAGSVIGWCLLDSTLSIVTGFGLNAVSNGAFLIAFMAPLVASGVLTRRPVGSPEARIA